MTKKPDLLLYKKPRKIPPLLPISIISLFIILLCTIGLFLFLNSSKNKDAGQNTSQTYSEESILGTSKTQTPEATPFNDPKSSSAPILPSPSPQTSTSTNFLNQQYNQTQSTITSTKAGFQSTFSVTLDSYQASTPSNVNIQLGSTNGNWLGMGIEISIPPGWNLASGNQLGSSIQIGEGILDVTLNGSKSSSTFTINNISDTQNHKARWLLKFSDPAYGERIMNLDGANGSGHSLKLDGPVAIPLKSPISIKFTIFSTTIGNPPTAGSYNWKTNYIFADGNLENEMSISIK